jgi:DNA-binding Lrp family transcriptional regulator
MMRPIFVMIKCEPGKAYEVAAKAVDSVTEIAELYSISGQYDLLVKCYLAADQDVGRFVTGKLQALAFVKDTLTIITFNAFT